MTPPGRSRLREAVEALVVAVVFALFVRTWIFQAFEIPSGSMEKNLLVGDHILVNKFVYGPAASPRERGLLPERPIRRGDIVVFKFPEDPERDFIKRCLGLPGDRIELVDKVLQVNGSPVDESGYTFYTDPITYPDSPFIPAHYRARDNFGPYLVPARHYFCLGDNRDSSHDSRFWGPVPVEYLKGRALLVYWSVASPEPPAADASRSAGARAPGAAPATAGPWWRRLAARARELARDTRWRRTFQLVR